MAVLDRPTYFEVAEVLPRALSEMGLKSITNGEAALCIARRRAREILKKHEESEHQLSDNLTVRAGRKPKVIVNQLSLFTALEEELRNDLRQVDVDRLTPLEALRVLAELKKKADNPR